MIAPAGQAWITPYGVMLVLALIACWWYARRRAGAAGIDRSHVDLAVPLLFTVAALGAYLFGLVSPADDQVAGELYRAHHRYRLFGLLMIGFPALLAYSRLAALGFRRLLDVFALPSLLFLIVLRGGCFLAGCCWGDLSLTAAELPAIEDTAIRAQVHTLPWFAGDWVITAVNFPAGSFAYQQQLALGLIEPGALSSLPVHPTQLYELALLTGLVVVLRAYDTKRRTPGHVALVTFGAYCALRFLIEYLRADNALVIGAHTFTQAICAILLTASLAALLVQAARRPSAEPAH